jgi:hypothetical protein
MVSLATMSAQGEATTRQLRLRRARSIGPQQLTYLSSHRSYTHPPQLASLLYQVIGEFTSIGTEEVICRLGVGRLSAYRASRVATPCISPTSHPILFESGIAKRIVPPCPQSALSLSRPEKRLDAVIDLQASSMLTWHPNDSPAMCIQLSKHCR